MTCPVPTFQLCPYKFSTEQDIIGTQNSRCRVPNILFQDGMLQPNSPVLLRITELPKETSICYHDAILENYLIEGELPKDFLCHAHPWPCGENDHRVTFEPSVQYFESTSSSATTTTTTSLSKTDKNYNIIAVAEDVMSGIRIDIIPIPIVGDAISLEATLTPVTQTYTNKTSRHEKKNGTEDETDKPKSDVFLPKALSGADMRLLKRSLRNKYTLVGSFIENTNHYLSRGTNLSNALSPFNLEVVSTSPMSGDRSSISWRNLKTTPSSPSSPINMTNCSIAAVRITSKTMITLTLQNEISNNVDERVQEEPIADRITIENALRQASSLATLARTSNDIHSSPSSSTSSSSSSSSVPSITETRNTVTSPSVVLHTLKELLLLPLWLQMNAPSESPPQLELLPRGLLLSGPPGVGKTYAVGEAISQIEQLGVEVMLLSVRGAEVLALGPGDAEAELRAIFKRANDFISYSPQVLTSTQSLSAPASSSSTSQKLRCGLIFLDELDALCPKRDGKLGTGAAGALSVRCVAQLLTLLDGMTSSYEEETSSKSLNQNDYRRKGTLFIVGATNRPNDLDEAVRRPGRLDKELHLQPPDVYERFNFLMNLVQSSSSSSHTATQGNITTSRYPEQLKVGLKEVAEKTVGFVAADLAALVREAKLQQLKLCLDEFDLLSMPKNQLHPPLPISSSPSSLLECLLFSLNHINASGLKHRWVNTPSTKWSEIGGYDSVKLKLRQAVEWPRQFRKDYSRLNLTPPRGVILYGPPGCSKTLLVKALASSSSLSFIALSAADVYSPMVGDAEASIRRAFALARHATPAILFFDEIDALVVDRASGGGGGGGAVESRVLSTFLNEMDGISSVDGDGLLVMAATNRPQSLDAALIRPGRFEAVIHVPAPDYEARCSIFQVHLKSIPVSNDVNIESLANSTINFTGAEIGGVVREATLCAMRRVCTTKDPSEKSNQDKIEITMEALDGSLEIELSMKDLETAIEAVRPLLSDAVKAASFSKEMGTGSWD